MDVVYQKKTLHEQILLRPDTYIGSIREKEYIDNIFTDGKIIEQSISINPALLRLYIEVISNAVDNKQRSDEMGVRCKSIVVNVCQQTGMVCIQNDGYSIPVLYDEKEKSWIPDMIFGCLLTSSNYDDTKERYTNGKNGIGVKCVNIFSTSFEIEVADPVNKKLYSQSWDTNMYNTEPPTIKKYQNKTGYTKVTWIPDFQYFRSNVGYNDNLMGLFHRVAHDVALTTGLPVYFNDNKISIKSLLDYTKLCGSSSKITFSTKSSQIVVIPSTDNGTTNMSWVNGIYTADGGIHVDAVSNPLLKNICQKLNQKIKSKKWKVSDIKQYFRFFVVSKISNPEFGTQTKCELTGPPVEPVVVEQKHLDQVFKWDWVDEVEKLAKLYDKKILKDTKRSSAPKSIAKYDPSNKSGVKCSLVLCEGDSAKAFVVGGIQYGILSQFNGGNLKGRDWFGVFPVKGKALNVRDISATVIAKNEEITNIIRILGVEHGVDYTKDANFKKLRYGRIICICDSDVDGIHIQGLIMNFLDVLFPTLLQRPGFFTSMKTPIVKVNKYSFYDLEEARSYIKNNNIKNGIKYYKGLGTYLKGEIKDIFGQQLIIYNSDAKYVDNLEKAFKQDNKDIRKDWLLEHWKIVDPKLSVEYTNQLDTNTVEISISAFINHELVKFSKADCERSLPNVMDGLKESQRKVLHVVLNKNITTSIKVAQLGASVAENTGYHHGEDNLGGVITKMAQSFVGSNNIPLLVDEGQFGTLLMGGKDAASTRYIYTKLQKYTKMIYMPDDSEIITYLEDEGKTIEPQYYIPIIPMILVNGSKGIGTGFSCDIPCYNPLDLIQWCRDWIYNDNDTRDIHPWYRNFKGDIVKVSSHKYETRGLCSVDGNVVTVTCLPIGMWIDKFKGILENLRDNGAISRLVNHSTPDSVHFNYVGTADVIKKYLITTLHTSNMVAFDTNGSITHYKTVQDLLKTFCNYRLEMYERRRESILTQLERDLRFNRIKLQFVTDVLDRTIDLYQEDDVLLSFVKERYDVVTDDITMLFQIPLKQCTKTHIDTLTSKITGLETKLNTIRSTTASEMWIRDLDVLETVLVKMCNDHELCRNNIH
jgi:DNA topoisomerase II